MPLSLARDGPCRLCDTITQLDVRREAGLELGTRQYEYPKPALLHVKATEAGLRQGFWGGGAVKDRMAVPWEKR